MWRAEHRWRITPPAQPCTPADPAWDLLATLTAQDHDCWHLCWSPALPHCSLSGALCAAAAQTEQALDVSALPVTLSHVSRARRRAARCCPSGQAAQGSALHAARPDPSPTPATGNSPPVRQWGALWCGASHVPSASCLGAEGQSTSVPPYHIIFQTNPNRDLSS